MVAVARVVNKVVAKRLVVVKAVSKVAAVVAGVVVVNAAAANNIGTSNSFEVSHSHGSPFLFLLTKTTT